MILQQFIYPVFWQHQIKTASLILLKERM